MADVRRFRTREERETKRKTRAARQLLLGLGLPAGDHETVRRALDALDREAEGWRFMQVNPDREAAIIAHVRRHAREHATAVIVLTEVRSSLSGTSQRTTRTQAEIAAALGLRREQASRAFKALLAAGAILAPVRERGSLTYDVDATFATKLGSDERAAEAARQARERERSERASAPPPQLRLVEVG
jgi:hypothetical protein